MHDEKVNIKWFKRYCSDSRPPCFTRENPLGELLEQEDKGGSNSCAKLWVYK